MPLYKPMRPKKKIVSTGLAKFYLEPRLTPNEPPDSAKDTRNNFPQNYRTKGKQCLLSTISSDTKRVVRDLDDVKLLRAPPGSEGLQAQPGGCPPVA